MFDCWTVGRNFFDHHLFLSKWSKIDTMRRDRNHSGIPTYVTATGVDENDVLVPSTSDVMAFQLTIPGENCWLSTTPLTPAMKASKWAQWHAFQDQAVAVIESHGSKISVPAKAEGLQPVTPALP